MSFESLKLSSATLKGLKGAGFTHQTLIQKETLTKGLAGVSILGSAPTGSGKTLCYILPILEKLSSLKWNGKFDGVGALILAPSRELAIQVFTTINSLGRYHSLSCGLVVGGHEAKTEARSIRGMSIIIATPGRFLFHLHNTHGFTCDSLQILVVDEADSCLAQDFRQQMEDIMQEIPQGRQTLLFSATQNKSTHKDLKKLVGCSPIYISIHGKVKKNALIREQASNDEGQDPDTHDTEQSNVSVTSTAESDSYCAPPQLFQTYCYAEEHEKLDLLFSFIKSHLSSKSIVFISTSNQVKFIFKTFSSLSPGLPLIALHGKLSQSKREASFIKFQNADRGILFATDIAARGLDFPNVDWVVQIDTPSNPKTYLHRIGRTARYRSGGKSLIFTPHSQASFIESLQNDGNTIQQVKIQPFAKFSTSQAFTAMMAKFPQVQKLAEKAVISYLKRIHLESDKTLFDISRIDIEKLASSYGLSHMKINLSFG